MAGKRFIVIGMGDGTGQSFLKEDVIEVISHSKVFSGGRRHHDIVKDLLPDGHEWIDITIPLDDVFGKYDSPRYDGTQIVVFASGDPLFFGFAGTLRRRNPESEIRIIPWFSSIQMLAHKMVIPMDGIRIVSLTGRPWHEFDKALIEGSGLIGVLTDKEHSPKNIARRMAYYGYDTYYIYIGEHLGSENKEKVSVMGVKEAMDYEAESPNCVIISGKPRERIFGIEDEALRHLEGRANMITKMPIRLITLQALELYEHDMLIDIGFCTGSVSVEAKLQFPSLCVLAIERREECRSIMEANCRKMGALGIDFRISDIEAFDLGQTDNIYRETTKREKPRKSFFIGGHGGRLSAIMGKIKKEMRKGDIMVINSVTEESKRTFEQEARNLGLSLSAPQRIVLDDHNPITILKAREDGRK